MLNALFHGPAAPLEIFLFLAAAAVAFVLFGNFKQGFRRVIFAVEHHIFDFLFQLFGQVVVHRQLAGVDDTHVQAGLDGVVQKHRVNRFAHRIIAPEGERHVGYTTAHTGVGQVFPDPAGGLNEIHRVVVVLVNAGGNGKNIRVKNNVLGREAHFVDQNAIGTFADFFLARRGIGLTIFIKRHYDHRCTILATKSGALNELFFAFLQTDGVDDRLALNAFQPGFNHGPLGGVDHHRHPSNIGFAGNQIEKAHHGFLGVQHCLIHIDVDHLGAALDLLQGDFECSGVILFHDQTLELGRAGNVTALTHVDEQGVLGDVEGFQARQATGRRNVGQRPRGVRGHGIGNRFDVLRCGTTATTDNVHQTAGRKLFDDGNHFLGGLIVFAELIGQAGVRVR